MVGRRAGATWRCATRSGCPRCRRSSTRFGVRPTYLVTYEMATASRERAPSCASWRDGGRCEIGTHLHPWTSPPFRPEDLAGHTYPHNLPPDLLDRQLTRADRRDRGRTWASRPTTLPRRPQRLRRAHAADPGAARVHGRHQRRPALQRAPQGRACRSRARRSSPTTPTTRTCAGRAASTILEIPITSATRAAPAQGAGAAYTTLPPIPYRGALKRLGLRPVWLRPSYTPLPDMLAFASRLARARRALLQHHLPLERAAAGRQPLHAGPAERRPLPGRPAALLEHLTGPLGGVGRTYARVRAGLVGAARDRMKRADGDAAPAAPPGGQRAPARTCWAAALARARARGRLPRPSATDSATRGRRLRAAAPARARARTRAAAGAGGGRDLVEGGPAGARRPTSCTSTRAPG